MDMGCPAFGPGPCGPGIGGILCRGIGWPGYGPCGPGVGGVPYVDIGCRGPGIGPCGPGVDQPLPP
jgi:hypothetical protein